MQLGEMILAGGVIVLCAVMLLRLALGPSRRERFDRAALNAWQRYPMRAWQALRDRQARRQRAHRESVRREADARLRDQAEYEAKRLIARARERASGRAPAPIVEREGNVIRPEAFRKPEPGATHPGSDTRH